MVNESDCVVISQKALVALLANLLYSGAQNVASSQLLAKSSRLSEFQLYSKVNNSNSVKCTNIKWNANQQTSFTHSYLAVYRTLPTSSTPPQQPINQAWRENGNSLSGRRKLPCLGKRLPKVIPWDGNRPTVPCHSVALCWIPIKGWRTMQVPLTPATAIIHPSHWTPLPAQLSLLCSISSPH